MSDVDRGRRASLIARVAGNVASGIVQRRDYHPDLADDIARRSIDIATAIIDRAHAIAKPSD